MTSNEIIKIDFILFFTHRKFIFDNNLSYFLYDCNKLSICLLYCKNILKWGLYCVLTLGADFSGHD